MMIRAFRAGGLLLSLFALGACAGAPEEEETTATAAEALSLPDKCVLGTVFTHEVTAGTLNLKHPHATVLNNVAFNGDRKAVLIVTPNWTPTAGGGEVPNYHPIGVWFDEETKLWNIYNDDDAPMPVGTGFNVRLAAPGFFERSPVPATSATSFAAVDMSRKAHLFVTPNFNPGGGSTGFNNWSSLYVTPTTVGTDVWHLGHADGVPFDANVAYNFADLTCASIFTVDATNQIGPAAGALPGPLAHDRSAIYFATNRVAEGPLPAALAGHLAVHWDDAKLRWLVSSWDFYVEALPLGSQMNVVGQTALP